MSALTDQAAGQVALSNARARWEAEKTLEASIALAIAKTYAEALTLAYVDPLHRRG